MKMLHIAVVLLVIMGSCKSKDDVSTKEIPVTLDGYDARMCACCGGQYFRVENDTIRYRFTELPKPVGPPIDYGKIRSFLIRFKPYEGACRSPELITVTSIRKR